GIEELRVGLGVSAIELLLRNTDHAWGELHLVELLGIVQHRRQAALADVGADAGDDLGGRERLAEDGLSESLVPGRYDVAVGPELFAQGAKLTGRVGRAAED